VLIATTEELQDKEHFLLDFKVWLNDLFAHPHVYKTMSLRLPNRLMLILLCLGMTQCRQ
jgi:hypothetical protein